jgi:hypothetical protein
MGLGQFIPCMKLAATFGKHLLYVNRSNYAFGTLGTRNAFPGISLVSHYRVNDRRILKAWLVIIKLIQCAHCADATHSYEQTRRRRARILSFVYEVSNRVCR